MVAVAPLSMGNQVIGFMDKEEDEACEIDSEDES